METINVYTILELNEEAKEKAIDHFYNINVEDDFWFEYLYGEAEELGIKITSFDEYHATGDFTEYPMEVANNIVKHFGDGMDIYQTALNFLEDIDKGITALTAENNSVDEFDQLDEEEIKEQVIEDLEGEFLREILEDYRIMLQAEWFYQTSENAILESLEANEYYFTRAGRFVA